MAPLAAINILLLIWLLLMHSGGIVLPCCAVCISGSHIATYFSDLQARLGKFEGG